MDGVSTAVGFVENGIKVIKFVRKTLADLKSAPEQLRSLSKTISHIEYSLKILQRVQFDTLGLTDDDTQMLDQWTSDATECLNKIARFITKMNKTGKNGEATVDKWRWLRKGNVLEEFVKDWSELRNSLNFIMMFVNA